jgi:S1-C subfamily serine protease
MRIVICSPGHRIAASPAGPLACRRVALPAVTLAVVLVLAAGCTGSGTTAASASGSAAAGGGAAPTVGLQQAFVSVIKKMLPSVVEIRTGSGLGSGVVFDSAGDIVTNAHVVGRARTFQVLLSSSASPRTAALVGTYPPDDLAVIRVSDPAGLRPAVFGDSAKLEVGDIVLAIGSPLGLAGSVTEGIVSAVGRTVSEPSGEESPGATLPDTIQTSASINPGNSGGALVDLAGQVVGIPTLAATDQQLGGAAPGIGFAISSDTARLIAGQLATSGTVTSSGRAALGVEVSTVVGADGTPAGTGVVSVISGGPAAKAGIAAGDVITAIGGTPTPDARALARVLAGLRPGQVASVALTRADGSKATVQVTLGQLPAS